MASIPFNKAQLNPDQFRQDRPIPLRKPTHRRVWRWRTEIGELQAGDATQQLGVAGALRRTCQLRTMWLPPQDETVTGKEQRNVCAARRAEPVWQIADKRQTIR